MRLGILLAIFVLTGFAAFGQQTQPTPPPPPPTSTPPPQPLPQAGRALRMPDPRLNSPFSLNRVSESDLLAVRVSRLQQFIAPLYRKPTDKELAAVSPGTTLLKKYSTFLDKPDKGIFRLVPDAGCAENERVISAKEECIKYSMPGAGNSFSFRTESYRIKHLADITLDGSDLRITGIFMHGMMANIGDVPIDDVTLNSPGLNALNSFVPLTKPEGVVEADAVFAQGIDSGGYRYLKQTTAVVDSTYVLRSVAYRGKVVRSARGVSYNELDFDKRKDVIVVFRVVEKRDDGSVTIVWKRLAEAESPRIKFPKVKTDGEKPEDDNADDEGNE